MSSETPRPAIPPSTPASIPTRNRRVTTFDADTRSRLHRRGVLVATGGFLLALAIGAALRLAGLSSQSWRSWLLLLAVTLLAQGGLAVATARGWSLRVPRDPHFVKLPALVAALLLVIYMFGAPEHRNLLLMGWMVALLFSAGLSARFVALLGCVVALGYVASLAAIPAERREPLTLGLTSGAIFLLINAYAGIVLGRMRDLRRRHRETTRRLEASEKRYRLLFEGSADGILLLDEAGAIVDANPSARGMLGLDDRPPPPRLEELRREGAEGEPLTPAALVGHGPGPREALLAGADRPPFRAELAAAPLELGGRTLVHCSLRDVTGQRRLEQQLSQARKMEAIGLLTSGIAHDFNNLLTAILGNADLALEELPPDAPGREELAAIRAAGESGAALVGRLMAFARRRDARGGTGELEPPLQRAAALLGHFLDDRVELELDLAGEPLVTPCEPGDVERILFNLAFNARDAMPDGGRLLVRTRRVDRPGAEGSGTPAGPVARLEVRDTGVGMDAATLERIFEPFFSTKSRDRGTGLGLATVFGIVHGAGGGIDVESRPGAGTTFRIDLPLGRRDDSDPATDDEAAPTARAPLALVVEGDDLVRRFIRTTLEHRGIEAVAFASAKRALEEVGSNGCRPDLLLCEAPTSPASSAAIEELWRSAQRPVLLGMRRSAVEPERFVPGDGADHLRWQWIAKPFTTLTLVARVREALQLGESDRRERPEDALAAAGDRLVGAEGR